MITGDGFVLRALEPSDAAAWKAGEDPEQIRWFEAPGPAPMENIVAAIRGWQAGWEEDGPVRQWGIWVDGRLAGGVELRVRRDEKANASYVVFPHARGRGLASSALRLAAQWAFRHLGVPAVVAVIDERNAPSRKVATRAGFILDGPAEPWECSESGSMVRYVGERSTLGDRPAESLRQSHRPLTQRRGRGGSSYADAVSPVRFEVSLLIDSFVSRVFPAAEGVVLAGSIAAGTATPTSDVDLLLIGPEQMFDEERTSLAAMYEDAGRLIEVFAYTPSTYRTWAASEVAAHRPVILVMLSEGLVLRESPELLELREWATQTVDSGPMIDQHALDVRRYMVSALLDDVSDAQDAGERCILLADAFRSLAELVLLAHGCWLGSGKWLMRRLREWDAGVAQHLSAALVAGDVASFVQHADELLAPLGGRLQAGMVR